MILQRSRPALCADADHRRNGLAVHAGESASPLDPASDTLPLPPAERTCVSSAGAPSCAGCGKVLKPRRPDQRYCSAACRAAASRRRDGDRLHDVLARIEEVLVRTCTVLERLERASATTRSE